MKLQMKDQLSFQEAMGYCINPEPMNEVEVKEHFSLWKRIVGSFTELSGQTAVRYHDELVQLECFLGELSKCEVVFSEPLTEYRYSVVFEYASPLSVFARDRAEAERLAIEKLRRNRTALESEKSWENTLIFSDSGAEVYDTMHAEG